MNPLHGEVLKTAYGSGARRVCHPTTWRSAPWSFGFTPSNLEASSSLAQKTVLTATQTEKPAVSTQLAVTTGGQRLGKPLVTLQNCAITANAANLRV